MRLAEYAFGILHDLAGAISESRRKVLIVGNRSSLLQFKNAELILKFTINRHSPLPVGEVS